MMVNTNLSDSESDDEVELVEEDHIVKEKMYVGIQEILLKDQDFDDTDTDSDTDEDKSTLEERINPSDNPASDRNFDEDQTISESESEDEINVAKKESADKEKNYDGIQEILIKNQDFADSDSETDDDDDDIATKESKFGEKENILDQNISDSDSEEEMDVTEEEKIINNENAYNGIQNILLQNQDLYDTDSDSDT